MSSSLSPLDPVRLQRRFFERFTRRTLIVHAGFPAGWFEELLKQPGGGGHFRVDSRIPVDQPPNPLEWVVHHFILPLALPLPLIARVDADSICIRHLVKNGTVAHPSEILWMLDDIQSRFHARLRAARDGFLSETGIALDDNRIETPYGTF